MADNDVVIKEGSLPGNDPSGQSNKNGTKHLSEAERARVRTLIFDGHLTASEIERITGYSKGQIKRARDHATVGKRSGRPRKSIPEDGKVEAKVEAKGKSPASKPRVRNRPKKPAPPVIEPHPRSAMAPFTPIDNSKTIVLVTGANRGIGLQIVASLLRSTSAGPGSGSGGPYHVFLCSRDLAKGQQAAGHLQPQHGNSVSVLQMDVTKSESIRSAAAAVYFQAGRVDILVNNAGIMKLSGDPVAVLRETLETNLVSAFAVSEEFKLLLMAQHQEGFRKDKRLLHVTSDLASITYRSNPSHPLYPTQAAEFRISKAALNMMAACQSHATQCAGVKVAVWNPGFTATELADQNPENKKLQGAKDAREAGDAFARVVAGERDGEFGKFLDTKEGTLDW